MRYIKGFARFSLLVSALVFVYEIGESNGYDNGYKDKTNELRSGENCYTEGEAIPPSNY